MPILTMPIPCLLAKLEDAFKNKDDAGCWCRLEHPTRLTTSGTPWVDIVKLVDVHKDGYFVFVSADRFAPAFAERCGLAHTFILRRDEIKLDWVGRGKNLVGNDLCGHALEEEWFLWNADLDD